MTYHYSSLLVCIIWHTKVQYSSLLVCSIWHTITHHCWYVLYETVRLLAVTSLVCSQTFAGAIFTVNRIHENVLIMFFIDISVHNVYCYTIHSELQTIWCWNKYLITFKCLNSIIFHLNLIHKEHSMQYRCWSRKSTSTSTKSTSPKSTSKNQQSTTASTTSTTATTTTKLRMIIDNLENMLYSKSCDDQCMSDLHLK